MENDLRIVGFVGLAILQERLICFDGAAIMNLIRVVSICAAAVSLF
jgi:hypothetical protein